MARDSISITVGGKLSDGRFLYTDAKHGTPSTTDTLAAVAAADVVGIAIGTAQADAAAAKVSTDASKTTADSGKTAADLSKTDVDLAQVAAAAAQTGIVALTPLTNAIATAKATPNQTNVDAIDTIYNTAGTGVHDAILTLDGLINAAKNAADTAQVSTDAAVAAALATKNAAATADTDTGTAKTSVDALDLTDVFSNLSAHALDESADVVVDWNTATIASDSELNDILRKVVSTAARGY